MFHFGSICSQTFRNAPEQKTSKKGLMTDCIVLPLKPIYEYF